MSALTPDEPRGTGEWTARADEPVARERISAQSWWDAAVLIVLAAIAVVGFETSFAGTNLLLAGLGGLAVGTGAAVLCAVLRIPALLSVVVGIAAYFLLGTPLVLQEFATAVVVPTAQSITGLVLGAIFGWNDVLTLSTPVEAPFYMAVLPYFAAWLTSFVSILLALKWLAAKRTLVRSVVVLLFPLTLFVVSILIGTDEAYYAAVRGIAFGALALVWLGRRHVRAQQLALGGDRAVVRGRLLGVAGVVVGAIVVGLAGGILLQPPAENRFVLRDEIEPPFDPNQFPSPLSGFRKYTKTEMDTELFTVTGMASGDRIRLAALDQYTGALWRIAGSDVALDGSNAYGIVGRTLPEPTLITADGERDIDVTILGYDDVWLPGVGYATSLEFEDEGSREHRDDLRYNAAAGVGMVVSGVEEGYEYRTTAVVQAQPGDEDLVSVATASVPQASPADVPDELVERAQEYAADATSPIDQLRAIEQGLRTNGFLSHGRESDAAPSRAGHGADRMLEMFSSDVMVGDQEQFASAMALMARSLDIPARVVVGFAPEVAEDADTVTVTGDDVTAWVEVPFEGVGWVAFDPTPEQTDVPAQTTPKPQTEPQPQVRQPPRQDDDDDDLLTKVLVDESQDEDDDALFGIPAWVFGVGGGALVLALIYFLPILVIASIKARRRRRRLVAAPADSAAGAWAELTDRFAELGYSVPRRRSRRQVADALETQYLAGGASAASPAEDGGPGTGGAPAPSAAREPLGLDAVARDVDRAVFDGAELDRDGADSVWVVTDGAVETARRSSSGTVRHWERFRVRPKREWVVRGSRTATRGGSEATA